MMPFRPIEARESISASETPMGKAGGTSIAGEPVRDAIDPTAKA